MNWLGSSKAPDAADDRRAKDVATMGAPVSSTATAVGSPGTTTDAWNGNTRLTVTAVVEVCWREF